MDKRICLITGATRGFGLSLAKKYNSLGYLVVGLARTAPPSEISGFFEAFFICDLSSEASIDNFIHKFENQFNRIDLFIHNAAIQNSYSILEAMQYSKMIDHEIAVNFSAPVKLTSALLPLLLQRKSLILIVTSLLQLGPKKSAPGYCASKAALANWTRNLRAQLSSSEIRVIEIIPGLIKTDMTSNAAKKGKEPDLLADIVIQKSHKDCIILPGARLAWFIAAFMPNFIRHKLLNGTG